MKDPRDDPPVRWSELGAVLCILFIVFVFVAIYWSGKHARGTDGARSEVQDR
jgi:hypothetical protein